MYVEYGIYHSDPCFFDIIKVLNNRTKRESQRMGLLDRIGVTCPFEGDEMALLKLLLHSLSNKRIDIFLGFFEIFRLQYISFKFFKVQESIKTFFDFAWVLSVILIVYLQSD